MTTYILIACLVLLLSISTYIRNKRAKKSVIAVVEDNCTGCQCCMKRCRRKALSLVVKENWKIVVVNPDTCTACGDCVAGCKFNALMIVDRK